MKQIILIIYFLIATNIGAQTLKTEKLDCVVLLDINYKGEVNLYDSKGKIMTKLKHNLAEEDYITFKIIGKNDSMFYVEASYSIKGFIEKGWIKKNNSKIGIFSRAYNSELNLYEKPKETSKIKSSIKEYTPQLLHIKDCQDNWLLISDTISAKKITGWISPNMQCANAYSTCN